MPCLYVYGKDFAEFIPQNSAKFRRVGWRMADGDAKNPSVDFRVSPKLYEYLGFLSRNTILGSKETDVARAVLVSRLEEMLREKYHETHAVPKEPKTDKGSGPG
jgi:hypothetical protein